MNRRLLLLAIGLVGCASTESPPPPTPNETAATNQTEIVAENLHVPWAVAFLPDGDLLVTERPGTLLRIGENNQQHVIEGVLHRGEGGLLGIALHPNFSTNRWLYLYLTTQDSRSVTNRVERYRYENDTLTDRTEIISDIPGASYHDGGQIAFGPDDYLYVTTGDAGVESSAQDTNSLAGKILRLHDDGSVPADNPFENAVYSYGHRNPQGLAWDNQDRLWSTEHGRSGILSGYDELNLIQPGQNYGWPEIQGDETKADMVTPMLHSGPDSTWAPASLAYGNGSLFFGGLRGASLYEVVLEDMQVQELRIHFSDMFGRLRATAFGPNSLLYITTSNTDGRGSPLTGDDKVLRINPSTLH